MGDSLHISLGQKGLLLIYTFSSNKQATKTPGFEIRSGNLTSTRSGVSVHR